MPFGENYSHERFFNHFQKHYFKDRETHNEEKFKKFLLKFINEIKKEHHVKFDKDIALGYAEKIFSAKEERNNLIRYAEEEYTKNLEYYNSENEKSIDYAKYKRNESNKYAKYKRNESNKYAKYKRNESNKYAKNNNEIKEVNGRYRERIGKANAEFKKRNTETNKEYNERFNQAQTEFAGAISDCKLARAGRINYAHKSFEEEIKNAKGFYESAHDEKSHGQSHQQGQRGREQTQQNKQQTGPGKKETFNRKYGEKLFSEIINPNEKIEFLSLLILPEIEFRLSKNKPLSQNEIIDICNKLKISESKDLNQLNTNIKKALLSIHPDIIKIDNKNKPLIEKQNKVAIALASVITAIKKNN